ncbi:MAG: ATP-binding cassette domain-containing protein [Chloroflexi bacterium]|nr:MAG: ATP-binding cassette domain-containing protein [Chloroflexota bacterium]
MGAVLQVRNLAIDVAARRVLSDASFTVGAGDKVGLVGRNGAGKTSLLKVLAGDDDAAGGIVLRRGTLVPKLPPGSRRAHQSPTPRSRTSCRVGASTARRRALPSCIAASSTITPSPASSFTPPRRRGTGSMAGIRASRTRGGSRRGSGSGWTASTCR